MANKSEIGNRNSQIALAAYAAFLIVLVATSSPRRVGDGGEYMAMAMNLAALRPPALSVSDLHRLEKRFKEIGSDYEVVPLEMPSLRGRDGRQDLPHFWLYPLLAALPLRIVEAIGAHPNHAFTILNLAVAGAAFLLLARRASPWIAGLILAGPLVWWIDKAHGDVFTVSLLAIGFAWLADPRAHGRALAALGAAAAQNPPLAAVFVLALIFVMYTAFWRGGARAPAFEARAPNPQPRTREAAAGAAVGLALAALPAAYYEWRLGVPTPIVGWTKFHVPAWREIGAFIWDPNIGLLVNNPFFAIAATLAVTLALVRRRVTVVNLWLPLACAIVLLVGFAQSVNVNHGATPGMNRWTLWLTALALPLLIDVSATRVRTTIAAAAMASLVWAIVWFHPNRGEDYKRPTRAAAWLWRSAPGIDNPPAEIFAERVSGAEPPLMPVATADCRKVLVVDGLWPVPCLPPLTPAPGCRASGTACYANEADEGYRFTTIRFPGGLDVRSARAWPLDERFARHLRTALDDIGIEGLTAAAAGQDRAMLRAAHGVAWTYALQAPDRLFVYVPKAAPGAVLTVRSPGPMGGAFVDLDSGERVISVVRGGQPWIAWDVRVPDKRPRLALVMKSAR